MAARTLDRGGIGGRLDTLSLTYSEPVSHSRRLRWLLPLRRDRLLAQLRRRHRRAPRSTCRSTRAARPTAARGPPVGLHPRRRRAGARRRRQRGRIAGLRRRRATRSPRACSARPDRSTPTPTASSTASVTSSPSRSPRRSAPARAAADSPSPALAAVTALAARRQQRRGDRGRGRPQRRLEARGLLLARLRRRGSRPLGQRALPRPAPAAGRRAPVALDAYTADTDSDARIDRVRVTFSEPLYYPGDAVGPDLLHRQRLHGLAASIRRRAPRSP